jgi:hypothetical protein
MVGTEDKKGLFVSRCVVVGSRAGDGGGSGRRGVVGLVVLSIEIFGSMREFGCSTRG